MNTTVYKLSSATYALIVSMKLRELMCMSREAPRFLALQPESFLTTAACSFSLPEGVIKVAFPRDTYLLVLSISTTWTFSNLESIAVVIWGHACIVLVLIAMPEVYHELYIVRENFSTSSFQIFKNGCRSHARSYPSYWLLSTCLC